MKQAPFIKGMQCFGGMGSLYFRKEDIQNILPNYDYGHAFSYLWRRFGPSEWGSDPYKDLVGYILTTKTKGLFLTCRCYLTSHIAFGIGLSIEIHEKVAEDLSKKREDWSEFTKEIYNALLDAIRELKRPTNVRDWFINIEGRVADKDIKKPVSYSKRAGYGITNDYYKKFKKTE